MERREQLATEQATEQAGIEDLRGQLVVAEQARDQALDEIDRIRAARVTRRAAVLSELDAALVALYDRQVVASGIGAGRLVGGRCGACRIELDRGELARITAAPDDEVLRCSECGAILLRVRGRGE